MAEISSKNYQDTLVDFYTDTVGQSTGSAPDFDTGIQPTLAPRVNVGIETKDSGNFMSNALRNSRVTGYGAGASKPFFQNFKIDLDKVYDFDVNMKNLSAGSGGDKTGPFKDLSESALALGKTGLGTFAASGNVGTTGFLVSLLNGRPGVENPVTGESTTSFVPFLDNLAMREKYNKWNQIKASLNSGDNRGYDMFRIGPHTFIRAQGDYNFRGNVGALGLTTPELHKIVAVSEGIDPRTYDYKTKTGNKILTYGNGIAGGYTLDGRHVSNTGQTASASLGMSSEFAQMAFKYFNGEVIGMDAARKIAHEWLATAHTFYKPYFGINLKNQYTTDEYQAMLDNFNTFVNKAKEMGSEVIDKDSDDNIIVGGDTGSPDTAQGRPFGVTGFPDTAQGRPFGVTGFPNTAQGRPFGVTGFPDTAQGRPSGVTGPFGESGMGQGRPFGVTGFPDTTQGMTFDMADIIGGLDSSDSSVVINSILARGPINAGISSDPSVKPNNVPSIPRGPLTTGIVMQQFGTPQYDDNNNNDDDKPDSVGTPFTGQEFQGRSFGQFAGDPYEEVTGMRRAMGGTIPSQKMQMGGEPANQAPFLVGGVSPTEVPEEQTVADTEDRAINENSFVVNAPAVEEIIINPEAINVAGVQDVRKMIMDAYTFARQQGMDIGNVDRSLYENAVDVSLSKGELVVPPELVKVIGKDRLEKINNRGKKEVKDRAEDLDEKRQKPAGMRLGGDLKMSTVLGNLISSIRGEPDLGPQDIIEDLPSPENEEPKSFIDMRTGEEMNFAVPKKEQGFVTLKRQAEVEGIPYEDLLESLESNTGAGYVPKQPNGQPYPKSGVTIGLGVDLGQHNEASFRKYGVPTNLIKAFKPFFGKKGKEAQRLLDKNNLVVETTDLRDLNNLVVKGKYEEFENKYPEFKNINDRDKGFMFAAHYHGALKNYVTFRNDYEKTNSIPTALATGLFPKITKDGVDRNRLDKALAWWQSQSKMPDIPMSRPVS